MINIKALDNIIFGETLESDNHSFKYLFNDIKTYLGQQKTGLVPRVELDKAKELYGPMGESKYGLDHIVAISDNEKIIKQLNSSIFVIPNHFFESYIPLKLESESNVWGKDNSAFQRIEPLEVGNSYVLAPAHESTSPMYGLTIINSNEAKKYLVFNPIKDEL